jgi:hypothetical protein
MTGPRDRGPFVIVTIYREIVHAYGPYSTHHAASRDVIAMRDGDADRGKDPDSVTYRICTIIGAPVG